MTTPQTYSSETVTLTPKAGTNALSLTGSASIMTNYAPARSVDARHRIRPIEDIHGNPIILSTGTEGALFAIMRSPKSATGWVQIDLTSGLSAGTVETFGTHPLADGTFAISVSLAGPNGPRVFLATPPADPGATVWDSPVAIWTEIPNRLGLKSVSAMTLGAAAGDTRPIVIATATRDGINHDRYVVTGGMEPWEPAPIPQNAHRSDGGDPVLDIVVGTFPNKQLVGTYVLYMVGDTLQLGFDSLRTPANEKKVGDTSIHVSMQVQAGTDAITVVDARPGGSDVFALADGIYHYDFETQIKKSAPKQIATLPAGTDGEIDALADANSFAIWTLRGGTLSYISGDIADAPDWSTLLPIRADVGQIAALRNSAYGANRLFDVDAANQLSYFYQDAGSTIWQQTPIHLPDSGKVVPIPSYTTVLSFTDKTGAPWQGKLKLSATGLIYATINGQSHALAPQSGTSMGMPEIATDTRGRITIISETKAASTPMIEVSSPDFVEVIDVNPAAVITQNLEGFTNAATLSAARTQTGQPVMGAKAKVSAQDAALAFSKLTTVIGAATPKTLTLRQQGQPPANQVDPGRLQQLHSAAFAMSVQPGMIAMDGLAERAPVFTGAVSDIKASLGDIWDSLTSGLETATEWGLHLVDVVGGKALKFVVKLAKGVFEVVLDTIETVLQALSWVFDQIELGLDKLIDWLGALLGFDDILATQKVIVNSFNKLLDRNVQQAADLKQTVNAGLDTAKAKIEKLDPDQLPQSGPLGLAEQQRSKDENASSPHSPVGSFSAYHLEHSGATDNSLSIDMALDKTITDFLDMVEKTGQAELEGWSKIFKDVLHGLKDGDLSVADMMKKVFVDQLAGTIKVAKILADGALDIIGDLVSLLKSVLNHVCDIPFFSALFRLRTNTPATLLNIFAFMVAIPTTQSLRIAGISDIAGKVNSLTDDAISPDQFYDLTHAKLDENGKITSETALIYNRVAGAVSIQLSSLADMMTALDIATGKLATRVFKVFRCLFLALKMPLKLPAITGGASEVLMVNYLFTAIGIVGSIISALALGPVGTAVTSITTSLLSAAVKYVTTVAAGIMAAVSVKPGAADYVLIWATTSTNLCNAIEAGVLGVLGALIEAANSGGQAEISALLLALAAVFMVWFVIRPILNTARLDTLIATGSDRPYWIG